MNSWILFFVAVGLIGLWRRYLGARDDLKALTLRMSVIRVHDEIYGAVWYILVSKVKVKNF